MSIAFLMIENSPSVGFEGIYSSVELSAEQILALSGANLGNFAFKYGMYEIISKEEKIYKVTYSSDPDAVRRNARLLVVAEANLINPDVDYGAAADFIEKVDLPVFCLGIGAQASKLHDRFEIKSGTLRYLQELSKRAPFIGVRGEYTKSIAEAFGISNCVALGCPSIFISSSNTYPARKHNNADRKGAVMEGIYSSDHPFYETMIELERSLFRLVSERGLDYIAQVDPRVISYAIGRHFDYSSADFDSLGTHVSPQLPVSQLVSIVASKARAYLNIKDWIIGLKNYDYIVGTRIHGTIIAMHAGVLPLMIVHDSRTKELAQTLSIPHFSIDYISQALADNADLLDLAESCFNEKAREEFFDNKLKLARDVGRLMADLELRPSKSFESMMG